jgi:hypothetical protein
MAAPVHVALFVLTLQIAAVSYVLNIGRMDILIVL